MTRALALRSWGTLGVPPPVLCPLRAFPITWGAEARQAAGLPGEGRGAPVSPHGGDKKEREKIHPSSAYRDLNLSIT